MWLWFPDLQWWCQWCWEARNSRIAHLPAGSRETPEVCAGLRLPCSSEGHVCPRPGHVSRAGSAISASLCHRRARCPCVLLQDLSPRWSFSVCHPHLSSREEPPVPAAGERHGFPPAHLSPLGSTEWQGTRSSNSEDRGREAWRRPVRMSSRTPSLRPPCHPI